MQKRKFLTLSALMLFLVSMFGSSYVAAKPSIGFGGTISFKKESPQGYGVVIPHHNMLTTMSIWGHQQGNFVLMNWQGTNQNTKTVAFEGKDIAHLYPQYFDGYVMNTLSNNEYANPWNNLWLNASAYDAENETLSPFSFTTTWNTYSFSEGGKIKAPFNSSIPMLINIEVKSSGPKMLRWDYITTGAIAPVPTISLRNPDGMNVQTTPTNPAPRAVTSGWAGGTFLNYVAFVADKPGTYSLYFYIQHNNPGYLYLKFLSVENKGLARNSLTVGGFESENPSTQDILNNKFGSEWYGISGRTGEKLRLDLSAQSTFGGTAPTIDIWQPTEGGYILTPAVGFGTFDLYFPTDGKYYISFTDASITGLYRYYLFAKEVPEIKYKLEEDLDVKISRDERFALDFSLKQAEFVRFNISLEGAGAPVWYTTTANNQFYAIDSNGNPLPGATENVPLATKTVAGQNIHYFYLPAGRYEAFLRNTDVKFDGTVRISSMILNGSTEDIPITNVTYPNTLPSSYLSHKFTADPKYKTLKNATYFEVNITEPGQYYLHTEIQRNENLESIPTTHVSPAHVVILNSSANTYYDLTSAALDPNQLFHAFSADGSETTDYLLLAYPQKWHDIDFNFQTFGDNPGQNLRAYCYDGTDFANQITITDNTNRFQQNGTIELNQGDNDYINWVPGFTNDLPGINEEEYFWLGIYTPNNYGTTPILRSLSLSNVTLSGDVNLALVGETEYEYADFWSPAFASEPTDLLVNFLTGNDNDTSQDILPFTNFFEPGIYKLLLIPEKWSNFGNVTLKFALVNYKTYAPGYQYLYNISANLERGLAPVHPSDIVNYETQTYGLTVNYNHTEHAYAASGGKSYIFINCTGQALNWTQLIVSVHNITSYNAYLTQDLIWVANTPNLERRQFGTNIAANRTFEFGVLVDEFTIVFEVTAPLNNKIGFDIVLSQYNTTRIVPTMPAGEGFWTPLAIGLAVGITIAAVVVIGIVVFIRKRR